VRLLLDAAGAEERLASGEGSAEEVLAARAALAERLCERGLGLLARAHVDRAAQLAPGDARIAALRSRLDA
jgi:hypothetical protein